MHRTTQQDSAAQILLPRIASLYSKRLPRAKWQEFWRNIVRRRSRAEGSSHTEATFLRQSALINQSCQSCLLGAIKFQLHDWVNEWQQFCAITFGVVRWKFGAVWVQLCVAADIDCNGLLLVRQKTVLGSSIQQRQRQLLFHLKPGFWKQDEKANFLWKRCDTSRLLRANS